MKNPSGRSELAEVHIWFKNTAVLPGNSSELPGNST